MRVSGACSGFTGLVGKDTTNHILSMKSKFLVGTLVSVSVWTAFDDYVLRLSGAEPEPLLADQAAAVSTSASSTEVMSDTMAGGHCQSKLS